MNVTNHTPFPSQTFEAVDQHGQAFHVFVLKQTLDFFERAPDGSPVYADSQAPLCEAEVFFADAAGGTRQESDYCPFKPACDVIVNATAHAPRGLPAKTLTVGLRVFRSTAQDRPLIDKTLTVTGERHFYRLPKARRLLRAALARASFGLLRPSSWRLGAPAPFTSLPLRYAHAYGGQNRIDAGDPSAAGIGAADRLTQEQLKNHPDAGAPPERRPVAHAACLPNLAGTGFSTGWYLRATGQRRVVAPRIEHAATPVTARHFCQQLRVRQTSASPMPEPAGLGVRPLLHPARHHLTGAIDQRFIDGDAALPEDFDFAVWNCAPPDQQIDFLHGDEVFELRNLCRPDAASALIDARGDTVLRLVLPPHQCLLLLELENGARLEQALAVDTLLIEPEDGRLTLVWRAVLPKEHTAPLASCAFGMQSFTERDQRQRAAAICGNARERGMAQAAGMRA